MFGGRTAHSGSGASAAGKGSSTAVDSSFPSRANPVDFAAASSTSLGTPANARQRSSESEKASPLSTTICTTIALGTFTSTIRVTSSHVRA